MKERGIIMSGESVRGILDGRKSQTRRVVKPQPPERGENYAFHPGTMVDGRPQSVLYEVVPDPAMPTAGLFDAHYWLDNPRRVGCCPHGKPGDRLWVRETWTALHPGHYADLRDIRPSNLSRNSPVFFRADDRCRDLSAEVRGYRYRSPLYLPKRFARIWLEVTELRVERVSDISEEDAKAEGVDPCEGRYDLGFWHVWDELHRKHTERIWASGPWVWVVSFKVLSTTGRPS